MAAIEYRGLNAVTNFDLSRYIKWLKPNHHNNNNENNTKLIHNSNPTICDTNEEEQGLNLFHTQNESFGREAKEKEMTTITPPQKGGGATSALGLLLQSSKFKEMMEMTNCTAADDDLATTQKSYTFPDDIQTYFECSDDHNSSSTKYGEGDIDFFNGFNFNGFHFA
jgi:AP2-like factor (ANT lineage)